MRIATVENGVIASIEMHDAIPLDKEGKIYVETDTANVGDAYIGSGKFQPQKRTFDKTLLTQLAKNRADSVAGTKAFYVTLSDGTKLKTLIDPETRTDLNTIAIWGQSHLESQLPRVDEDGNKFMLTGSQFIELSDKVNEVYVALYTATTHAIDGINNGTIINEEQLAEMQDAVFK